MKKFLIAAAGLSVFAAAAPAAAQYYPAPNYGYNQGNVVQSYLIRADRLRQMVERRDNRNRISEREARGLRSAAIDLQRRTREYARNGLTSRERYTLDQRFARLEQAIGRQTYDRNNRYGNGYGQGVGGGRDRDRDGVRDNRDGYVDANRNGIDDRREGYRTGDRDRDGVRDNRDGYVDANRNGIDDRREGRPYRR